MTNSATAFAAIFFSVLSIRLMMVVEGAQVIVSGTIGQQLQPQRLMAMAIGAHKFFIINTSIAFFSRISYLLFWLEGMQTERAVHTAALAMMKSVLRSNRVRIAATQTKHAATSVRRRASSGAISCSKSLRSTVKRSRKVAIIGK